ncbi:chromosome segregation protein [Stieleria maiorica]|uniref:Chromosome segregation protein n=1 Tax=Stieleria maiorica TaxID=2795974 RepID=A0A5B9MPN7_9BACT|nr:hypothetical protein [Stieleria maiorica]QEG01646.1 chromosome segregation protein [Stieleria maiorica]
MDDRRRNDYPTAYTTAAHPHAAPPITTSPEPTRAGGRFPGEVHRDWSYADGPGFTAMPHQTISPSFVTGTAADVRLYHAEIARLRHLLASTQSACAQQVTALRQRGEQAFVQQRNLLSGQIESLQQKLTSLQRENQQSQQSHAQEIVGVRNQLSQARRCAETANRQIVDLKQELANVATAASTEQQELQRSCESIVTRHHATIAEHLATIENLQKRVDDQEQILKHWRAAQEQAVQLSEWYESEHERDRARFAELSEDFAQFRSRTNEELTLCDDEIATLEATAGILATDHETVELINADLDHLNAKLESELQSLQVDLESVVAQSTRDGQEAQRVIERLRGELHEARVRLGAVSEEKQSLIETVANLKETADDFDASLFAKDQEIDATKRLVAETQRQLEQLRRENAGLASQNDQMRNRVRDVNNEVERLQSELADAKNRVEQAEAAVDEREHQLREIQSAARAADANALLRASEAEQQYAVELERLEAELAEQKESQDHRSNHEAAAQTRIAELEDALAESRRAVSASSAENDRLQQTIDQLGRRIADLEMAAETKAEQVTSLQAALADLQREASENEQENALLTSDSLDRKQQLAEFADRLASAQHTIEQQQKSLDEKEQQLESLQQSPPENESGTQTLEAVRAELETEFQARWSAQVRESEQHQLTLRERHHQNELNLQRTIDGLQRQIQELVDQRASFESQQAEATEQIRALQTEVDHWAQHKRPIDEVNRLSAELSRRIGQHAREREALLWRIEQLQTVRNLARAA